MRYVHLIFVCTFCLAGPAPRCASARAQSTAAAPDSGQTVDGVAARIEDDILTESEVQELGAFQQLVDGSEKPRTERIRELADQWIVRGEIETAKYPPPSAEDADRAYAQLEAQFSSPETLYGGGTDRGGRPPDARAAALSFTFPRFSISARGAD
jgi:hypothetical protein